MAAKSRIAPTLALLVACAAAPRAILAQPCTSTSTAMTSSVNPSLAGQTVMFTATVQIARRTPEGKVVFYDGATALNPIGAGVRSDTSTASYSTANLAIGTHAVTAHYVGDTYGFLCPSVSPPLAQVVNPAGALLDVQLCGTPFVAAGDSFTRFDAVISNSGSQPATNVRALFDPPTESLPSTCQGGPFATACDIGTLAPGSSTKIDFSAGNVNSDGYVQNVVVTSDQSGDSASFRLSVADCRNLAQACPLLERLARRSPSWLADSGGGAANRVPARACAPRRAAPGTS